MDLPIKIEVDESADHFILSTRDNEFRNGSHLQYSKNGIIVANGLFKTDIKEETISDDVDNSEYEEEFLDEDSETEQTQNISQTHSCEPSGCKAARARTTPAQVRKLFNFMNRHNKGSQRDSLDAMRILTDDLNAIGPPVRTCLQWRRTWSILKYNNKRKQQAILDAREQSKRMRIGMRSVLSEDHHNDDADATNSISSKTHDTNDEDIPSSKDHFHSQILKKLDLVIEQQTKQSNQLEKLNKNLAKLIDVLAEKIT